MIKEELDPSFENANTKMLSVLRRRRGRASIGTPSIDYTGKTHLEMTAVDGRSLREIIEIKEKARNKAILSEDEKKYVEVAEKRIYEDVVSDFFYQAFRLGIFHTDLHEGNVFCDPQNRVTEIDHGQAGIEDSIDRRNALIQYTLGIALKQPTLIGNAVAAFSPGVSSVDVENYLHSQPNYLRALTRFLTERNVQGSINRYTKALVNILPYTQKLDSFTLQRLMLPYISSRSIIFDILKTFPNIATETTSRIVARR